MKNTPLSELRKKSLQYFRKVGIVRGDGRRKKAIEYIVQKSYEALPKNIKKYIEDAEQIKANLYNTIIASGKSGEVEPYNALKQYAMDRKKEVATTPRSIFTSGSDKKCLTCILNITLTYTVSDFRRRNISKKKQN